MSLLSSQVRTVVLLFCGYAACYYCRADLSVATPLIADELARRGVSHAEALIHIGTISSLGVFAYALGKLFLTGLGDYWGGRRNFLIGVGGAAVFTLLFAGGGALPVFTLAWTANRLTQSVGWAGLIKVSSKWFNYSSYGSIAGILSISYLVGDALARQQMGMLLAHGYGWRVLFAFAGVVAALALLANVLWLRESRVREGHAEAEPNPALNLFTSGETRPASVAALLVPLMRSRAFLLVCLLSFGCTIIRETFNTWSPVYLRDFLGYSVSDSAGLSAIFPAVGAVSVLLAGWLSDRLGPTARSLLMFSGLAGAALALLALTGVPPGQSGSLLPVILIALVFFGLLGPYSYLGGAFALDFGGKQASAASSGIIDGIGYLGGVLAGDSVARLAVNFGWRGVFVALAVVSAAAAASAGYLHVLNLRTAALKTAATAGAHG
ncbi:MAG TPA: MFS transporter [Steroidobacteraceae bacterium]|nr:MFS transporter [Gammaproteobacteria bacterium]HEV2284512.1 MFS transporter [Steroidobacteraceae bacterium]